MVHLIRLIAIAGAAALAPTSPAFAHGTAPGETVTFVATQSIPNIPGKRVQSVIVDYAPGAQSVSHLHAKSAFIYAHVISGAVRSQVDEGPVETYRAGQTWFEHPGAHHRVSANASKTEPAKLLAVFIIDESETDLTFPQGK